VTRILWTLAAISAAAVSCRQKLNHRAQRFYYMDTIIEVTLAGVDSSRAAPLWGSLDSLMAQWDSRFSQNHEQSEIRLLNMRREETVAVSPLLGEMIALSLAWADTLDGGFDITLLPIKELWGLGEERPDSFAPPTGAAIAEALARTGGKRVHLSAAADSAGFADSSVVIDIGGVAKGFALREIARFLENEKIADYLVAAGGDIICRGRRSDGAPWRIGVQHPRRPGLLAAMPLKQGAVVTSGDYERFREYNGKRYHHIFNPETGRPCNRLQSLTIVARDPTIADILSTGLFCRTPAAVLDFVESREDLECLGVDAAGGVFISSGLKKQVKVYEG